MKDELGCVISPYSSRVCEKGAKSCIYHHGEADTIKSEFSPELCAMEILDEAIEAVKNEYDPDIEYSGHFDRAIEVLEKLKDKYNDR